jgi:DNA-binding CsgD family transcriptional regulator/PAS domain-containing protein
MSLDDRVSRLIQRIYAGIVDEREWAGAMDEVVAVTGTRWLLSSITNVDNGSYDRLGWHGGTGETSFAIGIEEFQRGETAPDPTIAWVTRNPNARYCDSRQALEDAPDYSASSFIKWDKARFGTEYWLCGFTPPSHGLSFTLSIHPHEGPVTKAQARLFSLLYEHAENAAAIYIRPPWLLGTSEPCFLLNRGGQVIWCNEAAEQLLSASSAVLLRTGRLGLRDAKADAMFQRALASVQIEEAPTPGGGMVRIEGAAGEPPLIAVVRAARHGPSFVQSLGPAALVRIVDTRGPMGHDDESAWRQAFGLTAAEARLARALIASDDGLKGAARMLGIAHATARVQLARIFDKLGVRSQSQLIRLLARL